MKISTLVALVALCTSGCVDVTHQSVPQAFEPDAPRLAQKLGISDDDWRAIQKLIAEERDYSLVRVELTMNHQIGGWFASKTPTGLEKHGPVFFYLKHGDLWYRSEEMSEWNDGK